MINASDFVSLMTPKESKNFKLAVVKDISQNNTAIIQFDGEEYPSSKSYAYLDTYNAQAGDRILLISLGGTYIIVGKVQYVEGSSVVVDDGFFKFETIRSRKGLGDQAVIARRNKPYGIPDRLYNIYVDNKVIKTATREYYSGQQAEWLDNFEVGQGTSVAIAFDGKWELHKNRYGLVTKGNPYLFWVDLDGGLYKQIWNDISTKEQLAENVVKVKSVRGWKNINFTDRDDGLIVGYIKDNGGVYYRNYSEGASGIYSWSVEEKVYEFAGVAVNMNLFITNDYRTGFIIEDNLGKVHWLITERNWAGMALAPHTVSVSPVEIKVEVIDIEYPKGYEVENISVSPVEIKAELLFARTDNGLVSISNIAMTRLDENLEEYEDWGFKIRFRLNYETMTMPVATLTDATTLSTLPIKGITEIEQGYEYEISIDDTLLEFGINNVENDITIKIIGARNEAGDDYDTIEENFTPINLVPGDIPLPEIEVIFNE